jgi:hypothetical protein
MRAYFIAVLTLALIFVLGGGTEAQSIYGPGGLFLNPTADFPAKGQLTPAFLLIPQESNELGGRRTWTSYTLDYGLTDRLEIAGTYLRVNPGSSGFRDGSFGGSLKYKVIEGQPGRRPDVAVGIGILGSGDVDAQVGFVALRYSLKEQEPRHPAHFHLGALYADDLNGVTHQDLVPYGGVDYTLTRNLIAFAEMRARMRAKPIGASDTEPPSAVGLVWRPTASLKLALALANNGWSDGHKLSFGIGFIRTIKR